jgi:NAD(P)-dependent dehydrogenase (short-subunit alcohol dehydrogenase family)
VGLTLPMARDLARSGIRVMAIAPGIFMTPMLAGLPKEAQDTLAASVTNPKRLGDPREYGQLAKFIVECGYMNGETIRIDGALRMM